MIIYSKKGKEGGGERQGEITKGFTGNDAIHFQSNCTALLVASALALNQHRYTINKIVKKKKRVYRANTTQIDRLKSSIVLLKILQNAKR